MKRTLALLFALAALLPAAHAKDGVSFVFNLMPGTTYVQSMSMEQVMKLEFAGTPMHQKTHMVMEASMPVEAIEGGSDKKVSLSYDRVLMKVDMAGQVMAYDSRDPDNGHEALKMAMSGLVGAKVEMTMSKDHEIKEINGLEAMIANQPPAQQQMMRQFLNKESMAQSMNLWLQQAFPAKPVATGDSWPAEMDTALPSIGSISLKGTNRYLGDETLDGVTCHVLELDMSMGIDLSGMAATNPQIAALGMTVDGGTMKGKLWWDNSIGMPRKSEIVQNMTMSMNDPTKPGTVMQIPLTQTIITTVTVK